MDTAAPAVVTCPRHPRREAEPALCTDCVDNARTAIWRLPEQHRLLLGVRHATRTRLERRSNGGSPPSISPWYDHADDIETALQRWANDWAEHLGAVDADGEPKRFGRAPSLCARFLLDNRRGNPLTIPGAAEALAGEMLRLHRTAAALLGDTEPKVTHHRVAGPCPECERCALYRTDDTERIRCHACPASMTPDEYRAHAQALAAAHRGAA